MKEKLAKISSTSGLALLASMTIATSALAGFKVAQAIPHNSDQKTADSWDGQDSTSFARDIGEKVTENETEKKEFTEGAPQTVSSRESDRSQSLLLTDNGQRPNTDNTLLNNLRTTTPTVNQTQFLPASPATLPDNTICLITVAGIAYDVEPLRSMHPGGDIFVCNTDMTAAYQGQHGMDVSRLAPYTYVTTAGNSAAVSGATVSPIITGGSVYRTDDSKIEDEDSGEHEVESESEYED